MQTRNADLDLRVRARVRERTFSCALKAGSSYRPSSPTCIIRGVSSGGEYSAVPGDMIVANAGNKETCYLVKGGVEARRGGLIWPEYKQFVSALARNTLAAYQVGGRGRVDPSPR